MLCIIGENRKSQYVKHPICNTTFKNITSRGKF